MTDFSYQSYQEYAAPRPLPVPQVQPVEEKSNPALAATIIYNDTPIPFSPPRKTRDYVKEAYQTDDVTYKCIKYLAGNGAAIPPKLYTDRTMQKEITDHPLLEKLENPNPEQTGVAYRESIISYLLIAGNSYQYVIRKGKQGPPDECWVMEPDKMQALPHPQRGIIGWKYDDFDDKVTIDPANIGHVKFWNPTNPIYGQSPIEVAAILIDQQTAARKWNLALMQNAAKSGGTWIAPTVLSPNDYSKTLEKLREIYAGFANAGKTQLLDGNLQWINQGMKPIEVDWLSAQQFNGGAIANILDMAPQLIGNTASTTYDNMDQAKAASYTEGVFPINDKIYALWNKWLVPMYPDLKKAYLYYDKESIEVLQAIIQAKNTAKIDQATKIFLAGGCDLFTYQQMVGDLVGVKPDPNGKGIYRVGMILVSSDKLSDYADQAMTLPANPPKPIPEPVSDNLPPAPGTGNQPQQGNTNESPSTAPASTTNPGNTNGLGKPARAGTANTAAGQVGSQAGGGKAQVVPLTARDASHHQSHMANDGSRRMEQKAGSGDVTHLLWECKASACAFCKENDGVIVAEGDDFPNGVTSPDDCHKFCECQAYELSIPDSVDANSLADLGIAAIAAAYAIGLITSRHDKDVAAQQEQDEEDDDEEDDTTKHIHDLAAARERKQRRLSRREEYRQFVGAMR